MDNKKASCSICSDEKSSLELFTSIDGVDYFECTTCGSLLADLNCIKKQFEYKDDYWQMECISAKERSFGSSLSRCAEVFFYSRIPINKFLDIGSGPGYLLDSLSILMPQFSSMFYGVELFPPPKKYRTSHENYFIGDMLDLKEKFSAGVCIEVIEHLTPDQLSVLVEKLAAISEKGAIYYFNSGQPSYVKNEDPEYLDPFVRGHIAAYSLSGLKEIFCRFGFTLIPLPGRNWGFLVEYLSAYSTHNLDELFNRLWSPLPENVSKLTSNGFGSLMYTMGLEAARCYLEVATAEERTKWAQSLQLKLEKTSQKNNIFNKLTSKIMKF